MEFTLTCMVKSDGVRGRREVSVKTRARWSMVLGEGIAFFFILRWAAIVAVDAVFTLVVNIAAVAALGTTVLVARRGKENHLQFVPSQVLLK